MLILFSAAGCLGLQANLNSDYIVDFKDFAIFARAWQAADANCDFNTDGIVDTKDLAVFAEQWLQVEGNHAPVLGTIGDKNVYEKELLTFDVNATDIDVNDILTYSCIYEGNTLPSGWNFADKTFTWTPDFNQSGTYSFRFDVNDGNLADSETIVITVYDTVWPVADSCSLSAYTFITKTITLTALDDGQPNPPGQLNYIITAEPNDSNCYIQDPASGCGKITANLLPYTLRNHGNIIWLAANSNETFTFNWKANDGLYDSNIATITTVVSPNPQDCLSFDEQGWVTIPDNNKLDLEPNRGIGVCFATRKPFVGILKKHEAGQAGYEIELVSGKIVATIYDVNGIAATIKSSERYDNGQWTNVVVAYNGTTNFLGMYIGSGLVDSNWYQNSEILWGDDAVSVPAGLYSNDCNLIIGKSNDAAYKWEIDAIRTYTLDFSDSFRTLACIQSRETAGNTETYVPVPIVRFKCNEGAGTTITNDKDPNLIGVFSDSNNVRWLPSNWYWSDINILRRNK